MTKKLKPNCLPLLIGSLPIDSHEEAVKLVFDYTPEIPLWIQLPFYKEERMIEQFLPGMPGLTVKDGKDFIDTKSTDFENEVLKFYEDYISSTEDKTSHLSSRFALTSDSAKGFFAFIKHMKSLSKLPVAVKGQITGPVTFGLSVTDENQKSIIYNDQLKDVAVKLIAMKAKWQARQLSVFDCPVIIFLDEPAFASFGSSPFVSISREEGVRYIEKTIRAIHSENGLAGIHICANADWSLALSSSADIVNFDAYSFFDKFILYPKHIKKFIESGRCLAFGSIPTSQAEDIEKATTSLLAMDLKEKISQIEKIGIDRAKILEQSFITPSCGTGTLSFAHAKKVLALTKEVSKIFQKDI